MQSNFWQIQTSPSFSLAPMEDVTDTVFREMVLRNSEKDKLHLLFSEFTSTDGLCHEIGHDKVKHRLQISASEQKLLKDKSVKLIAQIWGKNPEKYYKTAQYIAQETDFDGIDINMGCPVKNVVKSGCCSALIQEPELAKEIILATREGSNLPLSVKTRIGFNEVVTDSWVSHLLGMPIDALILHGRIQKQMSEGLADWNEINKAVTLRNEIAPHIKIIGNGDVLSYQDGLDKVNQFGVDGVMIGRGIFKDPWLFNPNLSEVDERTRLKMLWEHTELYEQTWQGNKNFAILKRFFKIYCKEFYGAAKLCHELMQTSSANEVKNALEFHKTNVEMKDLV
ncbi:tRNA-dihydrouridine synthase [Ancylomarina euxinus]|uniref:tRNA-dihydrouridine synthase n=1 Tax=Ancylomarina euxinus TaxID=2283627 RepID=A0A425Y3P1_9BACT|nr:tRNA-dihydrouridine synthase [Ancylomarina euxinus]MCZ4694511.1 tRNA-dihydrouridine synthase [Ancylomarina euxinus]MUP14054.1 tRNA-dihydrouridine synthase [Ancylomarina euxinus]RRG22915.1 tRNA-dihydrouridine synthase [Ancylomarina euxinus]